MNKNNISANSVFHLISQNLFVVKIFFIWRIFLFLPLIFGLKFINLQHNFLGGGLNNYLSNPYFWSWANFDGEHYISIALRGYGNFEQAFFPLFPALINILTRLIGLNQSNIALVGLILSNSAFFLALIYLYRLVKLDFNEAVAKFTLICVVIFPASYYFGSIYTESLFLLLSVMSIYFARKKHWFLAGAIGGFAAMTRFAGILLFIVLLVELFNEYKESKRQLFTNIVYTFMVPLGLLLFMYYLDRTFGDPLAFIHTLSAYGEQRSTSPIFLPQVFFRYIFRILPSVNYSYFPNVYTTFFELITAVIFGMIVFYSYFKLRLSYFLFLAGGYLLPTLSGSFSSLPRYALTLFPGFVIMAILVLKLPRNLQLVIFALLFIGLFVSTALFTRGYWIS